MVCRQLGYLEAVSVTVNSHFGSEAGADFRMDHVHCSGDEERLLDCWHFRSEDCGADEAFGVICQGKGPASEDALLCELYSGSERGVNKSVAGGAITGPKVCPHPNSSQSVCQNQTGVCLHNLTDAGSGNVFFNRKPVCDDGWDFLAANVACKELGFVGALRATTRSYFGLVPKVFSLDEVNCFGNETSLSNCSSSDVENCDGSEGAGVVCDTRSIEDLNQELEKISRECFSEAFYSLPEISFNKTRGLRGYFTSTDSAVSCQKACASIEGCGLFSYFSSEHACSIFQREGNALSKNSRSYNVSTGPRECKTEEPALVSYRGENCSEAGVACVSGGSGPWEGLAHLGGRPICQDGWGSPDARVFCRQMGFRDVLRSSGPGRFGTVKGPFSMNELQCQGTERSVSECAHQSPVSNCLKWEGAHVECLQFHVPPTTTTAPSSDCGGDCNVICLKGGSTCHEGNVFVRGQPVCDDNWGMEDAKVVCRQLGFPDARNYTIINHFGSIHTSRFSMDDVACRGDEARLQDCRHLSSDDCDSSEGAGEKWCLL